MRKLLYKKIHAQCARMCGCADFNFQCKPLVGGRSKLVLTYVVPSSKSVSEALHIATIVLSIIINIIHFKHNITYVVRVRKNGKYLFNYLFFGKRQIRIFEKINKQ